MVWNIIENIIFSSIWLLKIYETVRVGSVVRFYRESTIMGLLATMLR